MSTRSSRTSPWRSMSSRRPGVATSRSTPLPHLLGLRLVGHAAEDGDARCGRCRWTASRPTSSIWPHSSRVGVTTRAADARCGRRSGLVADASRALVHALQDGQHEGGRLAGARLGAAHDVAAGEHARDGLLLDRRRGLVAHGGDAGQELALRGRARRTRGSRPRGPGRRAARRACAPCSSRRRPGRRGHGRGRGRARSRPLPPRSSRRGRSSRRLRLSPCSAERSLCSGPAAGAAGAGAPE